MVDRSKFVRGGPGVRKKLSEESLKDSYRLNGVPRGSVMIRAHDRYRGDFTKGFDIGVISRKTSSSVHIRWRGDVEDSIYSQADARYEVDRGRWKSLGMVQGNPLDPDNPMVKVLDDLRGQVTHDDETPDRGDDEMTRISNAAKEREAAKAALSRGELKDRETYTAKQIAARCGTDAKTLRKFFRSDYSTIEPVGQGGRYEFAASDFPTIKREFEQWSTRPAVKKLADRKAAAEKAREERGEPEEQAEVPEPPRPRRAARRLEIIAELTQADLLDDADGKA